MWVRFSPSAMSMEQRIIGCSEDYGRTFIHNIVERGGIVHGVTFVPPGGWK